MSVKNFESTYGYLAKKYNCRIHEDLLDEDCESRQYSMGDGYEELCSYVSFVDLLSERYHFTLVGATPYGISLYIGGFIVRMIIGLTSVSCCGDPTLSQDRELHNYIVTVNPARLLGTSINWTGNVTRRFTDEEMMMSF